MLGRTISWLSILAMIAWTLFCGWLLLDAPGAIRSRAAAVDPLGLDLGGATDFVGTIATMSQMFTLFQWGCGMVLLLLVCIAGQLATLIARQDADAAIEDSRSRLRAYAAS